MGGQCHTRVYAFAGTSGKASNRTSLTNYDPDETDGSCQTTTSASSRSYSYDSADRITTSGTDYDALGRTLTTPAADAALPAVGDITMTYHTNDLARTISQDGRTTTYTLDVVADRYRSWTDDGSGGTITRTHHYTNDADSPTWTDEGGSSWTRAVAGLAGQAGIVAGGASSNHTWQVSDLHGDVVATVDGTDVGLASTHESTEYGQQRDSAQTGAVRYGWLGAKQRAADTPSGIVLMGARLYNPATGRFLQVDPIYGGSCNRYDYSCADPINKFDLAGTCNKWIDWARRSTKYVYNHVNVSVGFCPWKCIGGGFQGALSMLLAVRMALQRRASVSVGPHALATSASLDAPEPALD